MKITLEEMIKQQDKIFLDCDYVAFRNFLVENVGNAPSNPVALKASFHKARYEVKSMPDDLRHKSRKWLESHKINRLNQLPWPMKGELPL